ncbi:MAG: hypothetical protein LBB60_02090 [Desulfovibrio sp.]|jgi:hypothetical protein|nr:hypothetical protein [Desulfovibrio sp.]
MREAALLALSCMFFIGSLAGGSYGVSPLLCLILFFVCLGCFYRCLVLLFCSEAGHRLRGAMPRKTILSLLLLPVIALLFQTCLTKTAGALMMRNYRFFPQILWEGLHPYSVWYTLQHSTIGLFMKIPLYAVPAYCIFLAACVWWFARPKLQSACAVFCAVFLTAPFADFFLWVLHGMKIGHS